MNLTDLSLMDLLTIISFVVNFILLTKGAVEHDFANKLLLQKNKMIKQFQRTITDIIIGVKQ